MRQIMINDITFNLFNNGTIGIEVDGPNDVVAVEALEYICQQCNALMEDAAYE